MISTNEPRWGRMDLAVAQRRDVSAITKVVYAVLKCYENKKTGQCDPSQNMIADDSGASIRSVKRAIRQLVDARIIEADRTPGSSRTAYRFLDPRVQNDTMSWGQNGTSMGPKRHPHGAKVVRPRGQNGTSSIYNDDKKRKEKKKTNKRDAREKQHDPDFIKPDLDQQRIAENLVARWDAKYPHTKILSDMVGDQMALIQLQTIHKQTRADIEQIIDANAESVKFWPRPKNLINHIGNDDDKPMVWQKIKSDAMSQSKPQSQTRTPKRKISQDHLDAFARIEAGFKR